MEERVERERERDILFSGHFVNGHNIQYWAKPKSGASSESFTSVQGPKDLGRLPLISLELDQKQSSWGHEPAPKWDAGLAAGSLTCYVTMLAPTPSNTTDYLFYLRGRYQLAHCTNTGELESQLKFVALLVGI